MGVCEEVGRVKEKPALHNERGFPFRKAGFELLFPAPSENPFQDFRSEWDGCADGSRTDFKIKYYPGPFEARCLPYRKITNGIKGRQKNNDQNKDFCFHNCKF